MRRLSSLITVLALVGACDDDREDPGPMDSGSIIELPDGDITIPMGDGDGDGDVPTYPECPRETIPAYPPYAGDPPLTLTVAGLEACLNGCQDVSDAEFGACLSACEGFDTFDACFFDEFLSCISQDGGFCRQEWETLLCCQDEHRCRTSDCVDLNCSREQDILLGTPSTLGCLDDAIEQSTCLPIAQGNCLADNVDAGQPPAPDAGSFNDAGAGDAGTKSARKAGKPLSLETRVWRASKRSQRGIQGLNRHLLRALRTR